MTNETETRTSGGCFWGMQDLIRKRPGIVTTRSVTPRRRGERDLSSPRSHAEAIEIIFDPSTISYRDILALFFQIHDRPRRIAR